MDADRDEAVHDGAPEAPEANGLGADDYVVVDGAAPAGGGEGGAEGSEAAVAEGKLEDAPAKKAGSGVGSRGKKVGKAQNGMAAAAAAAAAEARGKKLGLSHSLSFPAKGAAAAAAGGAKKGGAAAMQPKPDGKNSALANGSEETPGRVPAKQANSARAAAARRSLPVKSGSVDATPNAGSSEVVQATEDTIKSLKHMLPGKTEEDARSTSSSTTTPRAAAQRKSTGVGFSFRLEERAEKRKEFFQKLEEKIHAKELEQTNLQAKSKESQEAEIKLLRKSLTFKATPMPSFYKEPGPPKVELKKIPPTRPRSPKLGRHKPASSASGADVSADGCALGGIPPSTNNSAKANEGLENNKPGFSVRKPVHRSLTKLPSQGSAPAKPETRPLNTKTKTSSSKPKVSKATVEQPQDKAVEVPPGPEGLTTEHIIDETTGHDLAAPLVASNEVPVQG